MVVFNYVHLVTYSDVEIVLSVSGSDWEDAVLSHAFKIEMYQNIDLCFIFSKLSNLFLAVHE